MKIRNRWLAWSTSALAAAMLLSVSAPAQADALWYTVSNANFQLKLSFQGRDFERERYEIEDVNLGTKLMINLLRQRDPDEKVPKNEILALYMPCQPYMPSQYMIGVWDKEFDQPIGEMLPFYIAHSVFEEDRNRNPKKTEISSFFQYGGDIMKQPQMSAAGGECIPCAGPGCEVLGVGDPCFEEGGTEIALSAKIEWAEISRKLWEQDLDKVDSVEEELPVCLKQFKTNAIAGHVDLSFLLGPIRAAGLGENGIEDPRAVIRGGNLSGNKPIALYMPLYIPDNE